MLNRAKTAPTCKNEKKARTLKRRGRKKARTPTKKVRTKKVKKGDGCPHLFPSPFFFSLFSGFLSGQKCHPA
jgi:hypothetical protein